MLRIEVTEHGRTGLPPIDVDDVSFVIGSDPAARVRLPASIARPDHIRIDGRTYRTADGSGSIGDGVTFTVGNYLVRVAPAPPGAVAAPPQRTVSLARELMRSLLGGDGAPTLEIERGPSAGAKRPLAPPESVLVIGRGDDATWVILDSDLSKRHVEIRRGWDGVRLTDLGSKNGTRVDGVAVRAVDLRDGAIIEFGNTVARYRDPTERHLAAEPRSAPVVVAAPAVTPRPFAFYAALAVMVLALVGIAWIAMSLLFGR